MLQKFDPRNEKIQIWVKDGLYPRSAAKVSVFDSVVQGGDAVWEGIRVYDGKIFALDRHLARLQHSAHTLNFPEVPSKEEIKNAIFTTLEANGMRDETHIRLTLTRGEKTTSGMDPRLNTFGPTLIVLAEWKAPVYKTTGIRMVTASIRRNGPQFLDSKIHHNNLLNNILAKMEANFAGVDAAIMLDQNGFVAEANGTNLFLVRGNKLRTPFAHACLPGITRGIVLEIAEELGIPCRERDLSISEFYNADQVFATGTMGELTLVTEIDGRAVVNRNDSGILELIQQRFKLKTATEGTRLPF